MDVSERSGRQQREASYYNKFYSQRERDLPPLEEVVAPVAGHETRPQNMGWASYALMAGLNLKGKTLFELGCGAGLRLPVWVHLGAEVYGGDISEVAIEGARRRCDHYGIGNRVHLDVTVAERLPYQDNFFDTVYGYGVLHHVEIAQAAREIHRVLKPGGTAAFVELIEWPFFERIRNLPPVLRLFPHDGFHPTDAHVTEDERKLNAGDERTLRSVFSSVEYRKFYFFERFSPFAPRLAGPLQKLDHRLFTLLPFMRNWASSALIVVRK